MANHDNAKVVVGLEPSQVLIHLLAEVAIQARKGFIQQEQFRP